MVTVVQWLLSNLLTLNCAKSRVVLFGSTRRLKSLNTVSIKINDSPLEHANTFKYLGVTLREDLSWNEHIKKSLTKPISDLDFLESAPKTNWAKRKITYQAAFDFNLLSTEIRETESILLFKKKLERMP